MISLLGQCVQNFTEALKYTFKGNVTFKSVISQAAKIGFDSLGISLIETPSIKISPLLTS